jgi:tetratricopeptide (TPR) repeat protein
MNPDGITLQFLEAGRDAFPDDVRGENKARFSTNLTTGLRDLEQFSLASRPNPEFILVHRLVQSVVKDQMLPDEFDKHLTLICNIGFCAFPEFAHENRFTWRNLQSEVIAITSEIKDMRTADAGRLLARVGKYFVEDGKAKDANSLLAIATETLGDALGDEHPDALIAWHDLAWSFHLIGEDEKAAWVEENVLEERCKILGNEHPDTLTAVHRLAIFYSELGRILDAVKMEEAVVEARCRVLGEEHLDTLRTMNNLASSYAELGRIEEATKIEEKVLEARQRILGHNHPDTLKTKNNLAISYKSLGRTQEAVEMEEILLATRRQVLGDGHPDTLVSMNNLAKSYHSLGRVKEAAEIQGNALETSIRIHGDQHPETEFLRRNLGAMGRSILTRTIRAEHPDMYTINKPTTTGSSELDDLGERQENCSTS